MSFSTQVPGVGQTVKFSRRNRLQSDKGRFFWKNRVMVTLIQVLIDSLCIVYIVNPTLIGCISHLSRVDDTCWIFKTSLKGGYLDVSYLTKLKNINIIEIYMKNQHKSSRIKNHKITKKKFF